MTQRVYWFLGAAGTFALAAAELWRFNPCMAAGAVGGFMAGFVAAFIASGDSPGDSV